ncbi:MAG: sodium-translocating pyrophosphatase [Candidatus Altiarchaeota archaeon]|nr:sodium-translocating pyrophosphatase [Candidatus Altiarchaeota archaeon]
MDTTYYLYIAILVGVFAVIYAIYLIRSILKEDEGTEKMQEIAVAIQEGADAFLKREFKTLAIVVILIAVILAFISEHKEFEALTFIVGAIVSAAAAYIGMWIATRTNVRVSNMARTSFPKTFKLAFSGGAVMGMLVVGLGLLGVTAIYFLSGDPELLIGYAFGSSLSALFLRVGGGIYTKSADVGADLVGKVEKGIPEDDPRNPAVIADNVGDCVGDTAGMGSDLFESYVSAIAATMVLGVSYGTELVILPIILAAAGIILSIVGTLFVRIPKDTGKGFQEQIRMATSAMNRGVIISNVLMIIVGYFIITSLISNTGLEITGLGIFYALVVGLVAGFIIGESTDYFTSPRFTPTLTVAKSTETGASVTILEGFSTGLLSVVPPALVVAAATVLAFNFAGLYGIAIASVGILGVLGINLSTDCYGPIVDNAAGIAEMCDLEEEVRTRAEALDAVGNTTAAMGKGFAIGSAALASLAWLATFYHKVGDTGLNPDLSIMNAELIAGLLLGAMLSFIFCSLTIKAVSRGGFEIVKEVRRQFNEIEGLMEGTAKPDSGRCVDIATTRALKEMVLPGLLVIFVPLIVGIWSIAALSGLLAGALITGFLLAIMMSNAGAAWDNAKKYIEAGNLGGKGSDAHKAAVVGDTVGDPFKDTSGPSLNILIKLIGKVGLIFIPLFVLL